MPGFYVNEDPEYAYDVENLFADGLTMAGKPEKVIRITVDKVGGGTVGSSYTGNWDVALKVGGLIYLETITTGMPKTHREVAAIFADFMSGNDEIEWPDNVSDRLELFAFDVLVDNE